MFIDDSVIVIHWLIVWDLDTDVIPSHGYKTIRMHSRRFSILPLRSFINRCQLLTFVKTDHENKVSFEIAIIPTSLQVHGIVCSHNCYYSTVCLYFCLMRDSLPEACSSWQCRIMKTICFNNYNLSYQHRPISVIVWCNQPNVVGRRLHI